MMDLDQAEREVDVRATTLDWFALYGAVSLALKHPQLTDERATRRVLEAWRRTLAALLVGTGLLGREDLAQMHAGVDVVARDEVQ